MKKGKLAIWLVGTWRWIVLKIKSLFISKKKAKAIVEKMAKGEIKQDPKVMAMQIARQIHPKVKNWRTAEEVLAEYKKEFGTIQYTTALLQTLVFHGLAVVQQLPDQRPRFKVTLTPDVRAMEIDETIKIYRGLIVTLEEEKSKIKLKPIKNHELPKLQQPR